MIAICKYIIIYICMHEHTHIHIQKVHMNNSEKSHSIALQKYIIFHFYSSNEQKCNTVLCGNMTK